MTKNFNWLAWVGTGAAAAAITLAGCATEMPSLPAGIEQKMENATTAADHNELASQYERQASADAATAKRHLGYAATYRRNKSPRSGVQAHENLAKHCEALARTYQQASDQNLEMARLHRALPR